MPSANGEKPPPLPSKIYREYVFDPAILAKLLNIDVPSASVIIVDKIWVEGEVPNQQWHIQTVQEV